MAAACRRATGSRPPPWWRSSAGPRARTSRGCGRPSPGCRWPASPAPWRRAPACSGRPAPPPSASSRPRRAISTRSRRWPAWPMPGTGQCCCLPSWPTTSRRPSWPRPGRRSPGWPRRWPAAAAGPGRDRPRPDAARRRASAQLSRAGRAGPGQATYGGGVSSAQMIDWNVATSTGVRWVRPGPQVSMAEARKVVAELRQLAAEVADPVRELTGLPGAPDDGIVAVVDRPGWIRANVDGFRVVLDPLVQHLQERGGPPGGSVISAVGSRVTGMQAGLILSYLASRVLGQYELFLPPDPDASAQDAPAGRLTLVAPNIVMVERELGVDPSDFRRWVCLHEETHRTQFTSVAWLRPYVQQQMTEFLLASDLDPASILDRLRGAADAVGGAVGGKGGGSLIEAIQSPRQREILERLTAVMTLVEGHGDYVMDAVGPSVVQPDRAGPAAHPGHRPED